MTRSLMLALVAGAAFPALAADFFASETLNAIVETDAQSFDFDFSDLDADSASATSFASLPISVSSFADTPGGGPASSNANVAGVRSLNMVTASGMTVSSAFAASDGSTGAIGLVEFVFAFTLNPSVDFVLDWEMNSGGNLLIGPAEVSLVGPGGDVFRQGFDGPGTLDGQAVGTLAAGSYTLRAVAQSSASGGGGSSGDSDSSFAIEFSVVPAPASLAMLGLGGLAIRRRR